MDRNKFDSYWEYLLKQKRPWARLTNISVTPIIFTMLTVKAVITGQPYFWVGKLLSPPYLSMILTTGGLGHPRSAALSARLRRASRVVDRPLVRLPSALQLAVCTLIVRECKRTAAHWSH